jgi:3-deoxy-D-arabino-heptulosonate 7-phosphate (DAHP) synthase
MTTLDIDNINVSAFDPMPSPEEIHARLPLSPSAAGLVMRGREVLRNILDRSDRACCRRRPVLDPRPGGRRSTMRAA